jgi:hypothetical protein
MWLKATFTLGNCLGKNTNNNTLVATATWQQLKQSFVVALPQVPEQVQLQSLPFLPKNPMKMSLKVDIRSKKLQLVLKCKKR